MRSKHLFLVLLFVCIAILTQRAAALADDAAPLATLALQVTDDTDQPLPCRVHVYDPAGKPVRPPKLPFWKDHFVIGGSAELALPAGAYRYEIERGPEYRPAAGEITLAASGRSNLDVTLARVANLRERGWYSGDLHVHRPLEDAQLLMRAEDLDVAPVITWWNNRNAWDKAEPPTPLLVPFDGRRFLHAMGGEDEREGGALLFFQLNRPLPIQHASREFPSPMTFVRQAREQPGAWVDVEKPFWWDVPTWLASGEVNSIGLANNHMCRSQMYENEAWGRPRDAERLPAPRGNGYWSQEIYYHILNCGLRVPPSAGSASGVLPNPVGYNRVYVHTGGELTWEKWWDGLRAGRSFVTNGPLLLVQANGALPGHVFKPTGDERAVTIELTAELLGNDDVHEIEIIQNGDVAYRVPVEKLSANASAASLTFDTSGWFLVRAIAENPRTFRFASTAPFYVEIGDQPHRISRRSVEFFQEWIDERIARVPMKVDDPAKLKEVLAEHESAKKFWQARVEAANAD